jgi:hypothetical protein
MGQNLVFWLVPLNDSFHFEDNLTHFFEQNLFFCRIVAPLQAIQNSLKFGLQHGEAVGWHRSYKKPTSLGLFVLLVFVRQPIFGVKLCLNLID